ncbi:MAG: hypothetical protein ACRDFB_05285, partial [Rhabdochlamydiaceae bacterium]
MSNTRFSSDNPWRNIMKIPTYLAMICVIVLAFTYSVSAPARTLNVVDQFGADPTGQKPASTQILKAFNAAHSGDEVLFPPGLYRIDAPIALTHDGVSIVGSVGSILKFDNSEDYLKHYNRRVGILDICANDVKVSGLFIDENFRASGRQFGTPNGIPLIGDINIGCNYSTGKVYHLSNITISNNTIWDYYGDAVNAPHPVLVRNFIVSDNQIYSHYFVMGLTKPNHKPQIHGYQAI